MTLAPELVDRFRADLEPLWPFVVDPGARLGLAVSGGADSLALLLLANALLPGRVEVATVDHGLRPEAAAEAELVARLCTGIGVPHAIHRVEVGTVASLDSPNRMSRPTASVRSRMADSGSPRRKLEAIPRAVVVTEMRSATSVRTGSAVHPAAISSDCMVAHVGSSSPLSTRLTVDCATPARRAIADCESRARVRAVRITVAAGSMATAFLCVYA